MSYTIIVLGSIAVFMSSNVCLLMELGAPIFNVYMFTIIKSS
jgi:hypothetical protein